MYATGRFLRNETGYALVTSMAIMVLVVILGVAAMNSSLFEIKSAGGDKQVKDDFFTTEAGGVEVYLDMDGKNPASTDRESSGKDYSVFDVSVQDQKLYPPDSDDDGWGDNYLSDEDDSYKFQVRYNGKGERPKGFGADFDAFEFDVTTQKGDNRGTRVSQGFLKIGPSDNS